MKFIKVKEKYLLYIYMYIKSTRCSKYNVTNFLLSAVSCVDATSVTVARDPAGFMG